MFITFNTFSNASMTQRRFINAGRNENSITGEC